MQIPMLLLGVSSDSCSEAALELSGRHVANTRMHSYRVVVALLALNVVKYAGSRFIAQREILTMRRFYLQ